jgi:hypothetical protein
MEKIENLCKNVIARYLQEEEGELPLDKGMPLTEYLLYKNKNSPSIDFSTPYNITNPYDYRDPSDKVKDQKDSPPFENILDTSTYYGYFPNPEIWETPYYNMWSKVKEIDFTTDEDEQQPALSITRKKLSHLVPDDIVISVNEFDNFVKRCKVAATLSEIINKDYHYKNNLKIDRSKRCRVFWVNRNKPNQYEKGLFIFRVSTPGSKFGYHTVYFQFLRNENIEARKYVDYPVHIGCTCPSFLYYGAQYYAVKEGYMYMPAFRPDLVPPKMQTQYTYSYSKEYLKNRKNPGRGLNFRVCKHILAVFDNIKNFPIEVHYKKYPITSPPSKIINKEVWKDLMKFEFDEDIIKQKLLSPKPKVPAYFSREAVTPAVIEWFKTVWFPRTDEQKIKALQEFVMYPERIFFILIEEAYLKRTQGKIISKKLVDEGYELMRKVIQPENKAKPQIIPEYKDVKTKGTGKIILPKLKIEDVEKEESRF